MAYNADQFNTPQHLVYVHLDTLFTRLTAKVATEDQAALLAYVKDDHFDECPCFIWDDVYRCIPAENRLRHGPALLRAGHDLDAAILRTGHAGLRGAVECS